MPSGPGCACARAPPFFHGGVRLEWIVGERVGCGFIEGQVRPVGATGWAGSAKPKPVLVLQVQASTGADAWFGEPIAPSLDLKIHT